MFGLVQGFTKQQIFSFFFFLPNEPLMYISVPYYLLSLNPKKQ